MNKNKFFSVCIMTSALCLSIFMAQKAAADSIVLPNGATLETLFSIGKGRKKITCAGKLKNKFIAGRAVKVADGTLFTPLQENMKNLKARLRSAASEKRKANIRKKMTNLKNRIRNENRICRAGPNGSSGSAPNTGGGDSGGSSPGNMPTGNCYGNGNVTEQGKKRFGIPLQLSANRSTGSQLHDYYSCKGCHMEKSGRNFSQIKSAGNGPPVFMFLSDQDYAHITAYLKRFELN